VVVAQFRRFGEQARDFLKGGACVLAGTGVI
jgi:hypothetical protein